MYEMFEDTKEQRGKSKALNRKRTDNAMAKRKKWRKDI
jgi:hypothetical protein